MNYKNNNGNIVMSNASSNSNKNSIFSNNNNALMENVNNNKNTRELNRVKADLKRAAREAVKNSNVLNALVARIDGIGSTDNIKPINKKVDRKNALRIQRIVHPNKAMPRFKNVRNANLRNRIRRNVTEMSALFQY